MGSLQYDAKNSSVSEGWVNSTVFLISPSSLSPFDVHIEIENYGELKYAKRINPKNIVWFNSWEEALKAGYKPNRCLKK